jgi:prepilin peptidase CpaA
MILSAIALLVFPAIMVFAASSDLLTMKISNLSVLALLVAFLVMAPLLGLSLEQIGMHLVVAIVVLLIGFTFFAFGWVGGGDAKLAAAIALWLGLGQILPFIIYSGLWGGTLTTTLLIIRRWPLPETFRRVTWVDRLHDNTKGVPYGLALAAAALFVYPHTDIYRALIATIG